MATAFLILRATELGLVAHPILGFNETVTAESLGLPDEMMVLALIVMGTKADEISPLLSEQQVHRDANRPERLSLDEFAFENRYGYPVRQGP